MESEGEALPNYRIDTTTGLTALPRDQSLKPETIMGICHSVSDDERWPEQLRPDHHYHGGGVIEVVRFCPAPRRSRHLRDRQRGRRGDGETRGRRSKLEQRQIHI